MSPFCLCISLSRFEPVFFFNLACVFPFQGQNLFFFFEIWRETCGILGSTDTVLFDLLIRYTSW